MVLIGLSLISHPFMVGAQGLNNILRNIEQQAPLLQSARANADASKAGIDIAKSQYWGDAQVFGQANHYNNDRLVNPISFPPTLTQSLFDNDIYGYGASFNLPLDIDGRIASKVQKNELLNQAAVQNIQQTRLVLFAQAVSLYRGMQQLKGVKQALNLQLDALKEHYKTSKAAVNVGRMAKVELLRIDAEMKSVEGKLAGLAGDEVRLRSGIAALIDSPSYTESITSLYKPPHKTLLNSDINKLINTRPDIKAARKLMQASDKNLLGAKKEWLPKLSFRADTLHNQGDTAIGQNNWNVGVQLKWEFWDGGRRSANIDKAHAGKIAVARQYQNLFNQARAQIKTAQAHWKSASQQYDAAAAGIKSAIKTEQIQSDRFNEGRLSAVDLIDAEASLARSRSEKISALANWWLADDQLLIARGLPPSDYNQKTIQASSTILENN